MKANKLIKNRIKERRLNIKRLDVLRIVDIVAGLIPYPTVGHLNHAKNVVNTFAKNNKLPYEHEFVKEF